MARKPTHFSAADAKAVGKYLGVTFRKFTPATLAVGMNEELEHGTRAGKLDVTHDDAILSAMIALVHLKEKPTYYTRLERAMRNPAHGPSQTKAARRARDYGGVGYFPTERDIKNRYPTGTKLRIRYGKTTGPFVASEEIWRLGARGLEPISQPLQWESYTDRVKQLLHATSLAILDVKPVRSAR